MSMHKQAVVSSKITQKMDSNPKDYKTKSEMTVHMKFQLLRQAIDVREQEILKLVEKHYSENNNTSDTKFLAFFDNQIQLVHNAVQKLSCETMQPESDYTVVQSYEYMTVDDTSSSSSSSSSSQSSRKPESKKKKSSSMSNKMKRFEQRLTQIEQQMKAPTSIPQQRQSVEFGNKDKRNNNNSSKCHQQSGIELIRSKPLTVWIKKSINSLLSTAKRNEISCQQHLPGVNYLLSLPLSAFVSRTKTSPMTTIEKNLENLKINNNNNNNNNMLKQQLQPIKNEKFELLDNDNNLLSENERRKWLCTINDGQFCSTSKPSIISTTPIIYSKDYWINNNKQKEQHQNLFRPWLADNTNKLSTTVDLNEHLQQCSERVKKLHNDYLVAIEKTTISQPPVESTSKYSQLTQVLPLPAKHSSIDKLASVTTTTTTTLPAVKYPLLSSTLPTATKETYSSVLNVMDTMKNMPINEWISKK
ncbi:unnamed protein product [Didymodactylos carnosus]|uniref:Uncharacterized protein n=1 Tax=Didymodactylos carnosus TaxID=1234261 RepID=A0A813TH94_9BILA|nr:unnamed protein product [Didymodactylos carnosus]CAF0837406.1 unnamed protein product [Didymodactylos carnosus]CAF3599754.1 unnamed protein product [Didymodactylos carnosus]CAF3622277.1 unnamed protein product [Didymodactylos carnosus]